MPDRSFNTLQMDDAEIRQAFAKCFLTGEGRIVLSFLQRIPSSAIWGLTVPPTSFGIWKASGTWYAISNRSLMVSELPRFCQPRFFCN